MDVATQAIRAIEAQSGHKEPPVQQQDLGWLGHIFGTRYATTNIAGIVAVAMVLLLVFIWYTTETPEAVEREFATGAFSLISLVLGYLFGSAKTRA
ncbi:MAG: hypothetical protein F4X11_07995 [Acidobacteria bacterium]|nr:hypothetical protein [Acidobacteriota bacterium]